MRIVYRLSPSYDFSLTSVFYHSLIQLEKLVQFLLSAQYYSESIFFLKLVMAKTYICYFVYILNGQVAYL